MELSEKLILATLEDERNIPYKSFRNYKEIEGVEVAESCRLPIFVINLLQKDPELLTFLKKSPEELVGDERKLLYALSSNLQNTEYWKHSLLYIFSRLGVEDSYPGKKKIFFMENNERLTGWAEYHVLKNNAIGVKIAKFPLNRDLRSSSEDLINLLYNLTQKYDSVSWVADPENTNAISIYNKIVNTCKGKTKDLKSLPYDIKITPEGLYVYLITRSDVEEHQLWNKLNYSFLKEIEGI